ncbi:MAG: tetratricopeptide repeat protein, partial [Anaerolineae bacterium]|nr:tetratricopeptide repeat protein [Anaerolineae bacterium]
NHCARHRTLNNAIQWSYELLSAHEQKLLCRMALCVGGVEEACAITLNAPHSAGYTRVILQALIDKHLCRRALAPGKTRGKAAVTCYVLFEAVREFARAQLQQNTADLAHAQQQLFEYVCQLAQHTQQALHTANEAAWLNKIEYHDGTVREALAWALTHDLDRAMRLCVCLGDFWLMRGRQIEGQRWLRPVLAHFEHHAAPNPQTHVQALSLMGYLAQQQANLPEAGEWQVKALALASKLNNLHVVCDAHNCLAWNAYQLGDYAQAQTHFADFLAAARGVGNPDSIAQALCSLAQVKLDLGNNAVSDILTEAKTLFLQSGDQRGLAYWARLHSRWLLRRDSPHHAINWLNYALALDVTAGYQFYRGLTCVDLARVHWSLGELAQAEQFAQQALRIFDEANLPFGLASIQRVLGLIAIAHGKLAEAEQHLLQSIQLAGQSNYKQCLAEAHLLLAYIKSMRQQTAEAQPLLTLAEQRFAALPNYLDPPELRFYQHVRAHLSAIPPAHTP